MTRQNKVQTCSLIDFYQSIPDYEDVMHLPSHELDDMLKNLRCMQKSYLDGRASPLLSTHFFEDEYPREDYTDFFLPERDSCSRSCPYSGPAARCSSSKYDSKLKSTFESPALGRDCTSTPFPKDSVTTGSTLSNKSSKSAISNEYPDVLLKPHRGRRKKNVGAKTERRSWSKPSTTYFDSTPQHRGGSPSFQKEYNCDDVYGDSWMESHPPRVQRSLPCSPVHRRSTKNVNTEKQKSRSRLQSYLSTPDIRMSEEKTNHVFRAQPFPKHIFSNYLNKREEKLNHQAESRRLRAEELRRTSFLPPSMRRRQKVNAITIRPEQPKTTDDESEGRRRHDTTSPDRFRNKRLSPYRKVERRSSSNKRRSRPTAVEAKDNLASLLRLQSSRLKLEAESRAAAEAAAACAERRIRARATRLSPVWHYALSRPTTAEDLMLKAARRRDEAAERSRRRRRAIAAMRERVRAAPSLMERQSLFNRTASSLGGFSYGDGAMKSTKHKDRNRRPTTSDVWRCYSNNHNDYARPSTQLSSHQSKRRRSRVVICNKNSFSDDEVQRHYQYNSKQRQKPHFSYQKDKQELFYDPHENDYGLHYRKERSRPSSPFKSIISANHSPNYRSPENGHSDDLSEEEQLLSPSRPSTSCNVNAGGRNSRVDWSFSDSHGENCSEIQQEQNRTSFSETRHGRTYSSPEHKQTEHSDEVSVSRDEFGTFGISSTRHFAPFSRSETWPKNSTKGAEHCDRSASLGQYDNHTGDNGRIEAVTKRFEDISLKCSSPTHEQVMETNCEDSARIEPWSNNCRSSQSSPQLRRRQHYHHYKTIHDSIPRLDSALQREYFNEENLRYNIRSPKRHLIQSKSFDKEP